MKETARAKGLDGLRGAAAMVVAGYHFFLLFPANRWTPGWKYSPLYAMIAGHEAVLIFFILSGFALRRMVERARPFSYGRFVWRRVLRIYGPYLAALLLAVAGNVWLSQGIRLGFSAWFNRSWPLPVTATEVRAHVLFLGDYNTDRFNGPFWSLVHEMRISLLFPLLMAIRERWAIAIAIAMMAAGTWLNPVLGTPNNWAETLHYAGFFAVGSLIAQKQHQLKRPGPLLLLMAMLLFLYGRAVTLVIPKQYSNALDIPVGAGAAVIVWFAAQPGFFEGRVWQWLGKRSYSLYLLHVPVLLSLVNLLNLQRPALWLAAVYAAAALAGAELFYWLVERSFLRWSRRSG